MMHDEVISALARTPVLLVALDFDGTLAPLVDVPSQSRMIVRARHALDALLALRDTRVALVSGRTLEDLSHVSEHDGASQIFLSGSHGTEFWFPNGYEALAEQAPSSTVADHTRAVTALVAGLDGVRIEEKPFGFGLHTRIANDASTSRALELIQDYADAHLESWRRRGGHDVVEYSERFEGKDAAIRALREVTGATSVVFAGDDETDEDAIVALEPGDVGIRVGGGESQAAVRVADAAALADTLDALATQRRLAGFEA